MECLVNTWEGDIEALEKVKVTWPGSPAEVDELGGASTLGS